MAKVQSLQDRLHVDGSRPFSARRSLYGFVDRLNPSTMLATFDVADPATHSPRRHVTTVPQQALFLMNNPFVIDQAKYAAARLLAENHTTNDARIARAYRLALGRFCLFQIALSILDAKNFRSLIGSVRRRLTSVYVVVPRFGISGRICVQPH